MIFGDHIFGAVVQVKAFVITMQAEQVESSPSWRTARLEDLELGHAGKQYGINQDGVVEGGVETFRNFQKLLEIENLFFLIDGTRSAELGYAFARAGP
jgi:hypothetical protein